MLLDGTAGLLTLEQLARRAARETRDGDRVYLDPGLHANVRRFLSYKTEVVSKTNGSPDVDVAFLAARTFLGQCDDSLLAALSDGPAGCGDSRAPAGRAKRLVVLADNACRAEAEIVGNSTRLAAAKGNGGNCRIITDMAVLDVTTMGLVLREVAPGVSAREVQQSTGTTLLAGPDLCEIKMP